MTKEELRLILDFAKESGFSEKTVNELQDLWDNCSNIVLLINSNDIRYVDYPQYYERSLIDTWLDKPLTDDEFNELSARLSHVGSYDSDQIMYEINDIRSEG